MKTTITCFLICITYFSYSQTKQKEIKIIPNPTLNACYVSFVTEKKDTLFLIDDDLGKWIAAVWKMDIRPELKRPKIVFISEPDIQRRQETKVSKQKG